jgi:hypothetical protein
VWMKEMFVDELTDIIKRRFSMLSNINAPAYAKRCFIRSSRRRKPPARDPYLLDVSANVHSCIYHAKPRRNLLKLLIHATP